MMQCREELEQGGARSTFQKTLKKKKKSVVKEILVWVYTLVSIGEKGLSLDQFNFNSCMEQGI